MPTELQARRWAYGALFFLAATLSFSIAFFEMASGVLIASAAWGWFRSEKRSFSRDLLVTLCGVYFLTVLLSLTQTVYWAASIRGVFKVLKNIAIFLSVIFVLDSVPKLRRLVEAMLWISVALGVDALIQSVLGHDPIRQRPMTAYWGETYRVTATFGHANNFAAYLSLVIPLTLGLLWGREHFFGSKKRWVLWAGLGVLFLSLVWTYSRSAWAAVLAATAILAVLKKNGGLLILLIAGLMLGALFAPVKVKQRFLSLGDPSSGTVVERKILWKESFRMIAQNPWLGLGVNTYAVNEPHFKSKEVYTDNQYAHNGYLQMAAEIGLLGLLSFVLCIGYGLISAGITLFRTREPFVGAAGLGLLAGLLAFLMHAATDTDLQSTLLINLFWFSMGVLWAAKRLADSARV